ncbi:GNAT family N-acetyltransferase [Cytobacillus sp. IB215665]|uniref:GNAT family N-acetyltransferase n=1 Tax=Cytobacillus sp. IB215665 TaxID=3097357 RepID=UPI002A0B4419|nr:GNAT family N-acetyltransferase [Cytobacillus sp. IB215665]MDX8365805.1 GNAT family N-acetyltransferase [Cytobacillus sp. IB215665]
MKNILRGVNRFYIENADQLIAEITFVNSGTERLIIDHTFVSNELRGEGIGEALVDKVVNLAREENKKIIPLCPFAKSQFDKKPDYRDVLAH